MGLPFPMGSLNTRDVLIDTFRQHVGEGCLFHMQLMLEHASTKLSGDVAQCVLPAALPVGKHR